MAGEEAHARGVLLAEHCIDNGLDVARLLSDEEHGLIRIGEGPVPRPDAVRGYDGQGCRAPARGQLVARTDRTASANTYA